jgi:hypothetical protein
MNYNLLPMHYDAVITLKRASYKNGRRKRLCCPILFGHVDKIGHTPNKVNCRRAWSDGEVADAVNVVPTGQGAINCSYIP